VTSVGPAIDGLFEDGPNGMQLFGSQCSSCGVPSFPRSDRCKNPDCGDPVVVEAAFGGQGTLWSFAIDHYPPPAPVLHTEPFVPFAVGLVDLDDGLRLLGRIQIQDFSRLRPGMKVNLVSGPIGRDEQGVERMAWTFAPVGGDQR
jgi:uncharacterized OB-fold protein